MFWVAALLKHLVLPHPVCLGAVVGPHRFPTRGQERLDFDCDARGVSVEGTRFGAAGGDMTLASDGIFYMLDDVPLPSRGLYTHCARDFTAVKTRSKVYHPHTKSLSSFIICQSLLGM